MANTKPSKERAQIKQRAARLRAVRAEELREKIQGDAILRRLEDIDEEYKNIAKNLKTYQKGISEDKSRQIKLRLEALGKSADLNFKKLRKLIPDMSHVDMGTDGEDNIFEMFTKAVANGIDKARALPGEAIPVDEDDRATKH